MQRSLKLAFLLAGPVFLMTSCNHRMADMVVPLDYPESFSGSGEDEMQPGWWTVFNDPLLNAAVDSGLKSNFSLEAAWQRLIVARSVMKREASAFFPSFETSVTGEITNENGTENEESLLLVLSSSYEIDLWGRIRSSVQAERFRAAASYYDYKSAAISLSAEIVRTWFALTEALNQVALINEQIETNEQVLDLMRNRFGGGQIRAVDILRQRQLLESTKEQKASAEIRVRLQKHQLDILTGRIPGDEREFPFNNLPDIPALPETGIPSEIINRRPDVQSAYNLLLAADRDLASAISNRYPRIALSASIFSQTNGTGSLLNDWLYTLGGNLIAPIFQGGRLKSEARRTEAVKRQLFFEYAQAVQIAFREVEDALVQESRQHEIIRSLMEQVELARKSYEQLRIEYFNGFGNYLEVLTALGQEQQLRRDLLSARLALLDYRIALYRALAGGFETGRDSDG